MTTVKQPSWRASRSEIRDAVVCDGLLPWTPTFLPPGADLRAVLAPSWKSWPRPRPRWRARARRGRRRR